MASGKIKGITIEIGGDTTKLGKAIADSEKQSRSLQGELKQVEKLLQFDPGNTELLAQKQKILTDAVKETTEKLEILRKAEEQVVEQFNRGDIGEDQLRAFQREIIKTQSELDGFEAKLNGTADSIEDVGDAAEQGGDGFTIMGGALADLVSNVIQGAISAIGDLIGSLFELSEATEEYRTMQAKLEGSANTFGYSMEFANGKYKEFYKYLGDDQMSTNAITNLMGLGTSTENVSALAEAAIGVWSAYGDSIPIEGLTEAMNETAQVGKVTGSLADALNWAGISEDEFNEKLEKCGSTQERADLIAKTLNDTYGESKKTYDELNGSITEANEAELALKDTQAQLGETMQPVNTAITNLKNQALEAIVPLVERCANAFLDMLNWLKEHPAAMQAITAVAIGLATAFGVLATALAIQGIITGVTKAIAFLNTTLLANPIVLIVALIAGLVAAFIYLWNNCDAFREFWLDLWEKIQSFTKKAVDAISKFFTQTVPNALDKMVTFFKQLPGKIWTWLSNTVNKVTTWASNMKSKAQSAATNFINTVINYIKQLPSKVWTWLTNVVSKVKTWGSNLVSAAKTAVSNMVTNVVNTAKSLPGKFLQIGKDIINGIKNGISSAVSGLYSTIKNSLSGLVDKAKQALGINSPSKVFAEVVGRAIPEGIGKGVDDNADIAENSVQDMTDNLTDQALNLNGATIKRKLTATFAANSLSPNNNSALLSKLDGIYERLNRLQIVLDTGTLVGETIDKIDAGLATRQLLSARGV